MSAVSKIVQDDSIRSSIFSEYANEPGTHDRASFAPENRSDSALEEFRNDLQSASEAVIRLYRGLPKIRITSAKSRMEIASLFDEALPEDPRSMDAILEQVENSIFRIPHCVRVPDFSDTSML